MNHYARYFSMKPDMADHRSGKRRHGAGRFFFTGREFMSRQKPPIIAASAEDHPDKPSNLERDDTIERVNELCDSHT